MRTAFLTAFVLSLSMAPPTAARAAADSAPMAGPAAGEAAPADGRGEGKLDMVRSAPVSLGQAIGIAEKRHPGTKSLRIETDVIAEDWFIAFARRATGRCGRVSFRRSPARF